MTFQLPACDRCTLGVMDATNPHLLGTCPCACHESVPESASTNLDLIEDPAQAIATQYGFADAEA